MRATQWLVVSFFVIAARAAPAAVVINDGDFVGWIFGSYTVNAGTASVTLEAAGGNPGARLNVTTVTPGASDTATGTAIKPDYSTSAILAGTPFTVTFDVLSGAGAFGQGQGVALLVEQGGAVYATSLGVTNVQASFTTLSFGGTFNAASFTLVSGSGPATPDFSGATATRFGLAAGTRRAPR
jgi:hypothetical protein